jgi:hypothetical protein
MIFRWIEITNNKESKESKQKRREIPLQDRANNNRANNNRANNNRANNNQENNQENINLKITCKKTRLTGFNKGNHFFDELSMNSPFI